MKIVNKLLKKLVSFYRSKLSSSLPTSCIYTPTCSAYALEALEKHGAFYAVFLIIRRIVRCNPFATGGFDPVPDSKKTLKWLI